METSQQVVDLLRDGFHAALRFGRGLGGVESEPLFDVPLPLIALASPKRRAPCRTTRPRRSPDSLLVSAMSGNTGSTRPGCAFR